MGRAFEISNCYIQSSSWKGVIVPRFEHLYWVVIRSLREIGVNWGLDKNFAQAEVPRRMQSGHSWPR